MASNTLQIHLVVILGIIVYQKMLTFRAANFYNNLMLSVLYIYMFRKYETNEVNQSVICGHIYAVLQRTCAPIIIPSANRLRKKQFLLNTGRKTNTTCICNICCCSYPLGWNKTSPIRKMQMQNKLDYTYLGLISLENAARLKALHFSNSSVDVTQKRTILIGGP